MSNGINNLKPMNTLTEEEQREIASKGGKASVAARRAKKTLREHLDILLAQSIKNGDTGEETLCKEALGVAIITKALAGDMKAWELIRDTIGEKPVDKKELTGADGKPLEVVRYITPEEQKTVHDHINDFINGN